ncbi:MAG: extracellular solute-binding protein [Dehalococcoidia bacterium]|nr:extracellular solute-binding protein [Dehalococcoidia bacterium]
MKKLIIPPILLLILGFVFFLSCSPPSPPVSTPISTPSQIQSPAGVSAQPALQDIAWQKVITEAKKEAIVTIYSFGFVSDLGNALSSAFANKYGIKVELVTGTGAQLVPRIQSEYRVGQNVADMLEGATNNAILARDEGLSQAYGDLPQFRNKETFIVDPGFDKQGHIIAYQYVVYPIIVNTRLVSPADSPKSWKSLLEPKWKGKIVANDPDTMSIPNAQYIFLTRYLGFQDEYFRELGKQDLVIAPTMRESDSMVARGQYPILLTSSPVTSAPLMAEGAPITPFELSEGVPAQRSPTISMMSKAPHPNAARLFLDWLMSKEGQDVHGRTRSTSSIRKDVTDYSPPQARIKFTKVVALSEQDTLDATKAQREKVLSKLWRAK